MKKGSGVHVKEFCEVPKEKSHVTDLRDLQGETLKAPVLCWRKHRQLPFLSFSVGVSHTAL